MPDPYAREIYQDDFLQDAREAGSSAFALPIDCAVIDGRGDRDVMEELRTLKEENQTLKKKNGEMLRMIVANQLHY